MHTNNVTFIPDSTSGPSTFPPFVGPILYSHTPGALTLDSLYKMKSIYMEF